MKYCIGVFLGSLEPHEQQIAQGIREYVAEHDLNWELITILPRESIQQTLDWLPANRQLNGLIGHQHSAGWFDWARQQNIPRISLSGPIVQDPLELAIRVDAHLLGKMTARYAHACGFRDVTSLDHFGGGHRRERIEAFFAQAEELGLRVHPFPVTEKLRENPTTFEAYRLNFIRSIGRQLFIFFHQDRSAAWFCGCAQSLGLRIPEEAAVIGVDNVVSVCEARDPHLTSIALPYSHMGKLSALELHRMLCGGQPSAPLLEVPPLRVIERQSVKVVASKDPIVNDAIEMLRSNKLLSIEQLTGKMNVAHATLCRRFKRAVQLSPKAMQLQLRLDQAERLLLESTDSVASIAEQCGFQNRVSFHLVFKRRFGTAPQKLREMNVGDV